MRLGKFVSYSFLFLLFTASGTAFLTEGQAQTLETVSLVLMGLSGTSLVALTALKYKDESGSVSKPEAANKLKSVQSYVTTQIEMGNTLPNENEVIEMLEDAADQVEAGNYSRGMEELKEIEDMLGKEFD